MNFESKRLEEVLNSIKHNRILRQVWKEGRERATASVMAAREFDRKHPKFKTR